MNGPVAFVAQPGVGDFGAANLAWVRLASARATTYPAGWPGGIGVDLVGAKYTHGAHDPVLAPLAAPDADGNATLTLTDAGLAAPLLGALNIDAKNHAAFVVGPLVKPVLKFNAKTGAITGSFKHPETNKTTQLKGILLDAQQLGLGFFLSDKQGGALTLAPSP